MTIFTMKNEKARSFGLDEVKGMTPNIITYNSLLNK